MHPFTTQLGSRKLTARDLARLKKEQQKTAKRDKKRGGKRQIHLLFEEMKARQQRDGLMDDSMSSNILHPHQPNDANMEHESNSNCAQSTNLYVGNLPLNICETELIEIFGRYGIIESVKIMWPRTEAEHARDRLCGFVSYLRRCDAEIALHELKDNHLFGERLRLGWGKAVMSKKKKTDNLPMTMMDHDSDSNINLMEYQVPPTAVKYIIKKPDDTLLKQVIDRTAYYDAQIGKEFEAQVIQKEVIEAKNVQFESFLLANGSDLNKYYRWRVYSISMGDSLYFWRRTPFQIIQNGPYWIPPMIEDKDKEIESDIFFLKKHKHKNKRRRIAKNNNVQQNEFNNKKRRINLTQRPLSDRDRAKFMMLLRNLSCKRFKIKEAMIFCLDHSDRAVEVCQILSEALTLSETAFNKKLARLFLVSDVLCNCNTAKIKNASLYRSEFKNKHLMQIFKSLYPHNQNSLIKEKVLKVIKVWDNNCVFPSFFTSQLKQLFVYGEVAKQEKSVFVADKGFIQDEGKRREIDKEKNKNLIYPPHQKLFIAKKGNNPNKAFTASSFAKLTQKREEIEVEDDDDDDGQNVFTQMMGNKSERSQDISMRHCMNVDTVKNVFPGKYDGEPLPIAECIDIELL